MEKNVRPTSGLGSARHQMFVVLSTFLMLGSGGPASASQQRPGSALFDRAGTHASVFVGYARTGNRIIDIDGFANWGNSGSILDYADTGLVVGALVGKKFDFGDVPLRLEVDATFGNLSANTDRLDPEGLDETAESEFRGITTARAGVEQAIGPATAFATVGIAVAGIANSVTDIDFRQGEMPRVDPDDSFRDSALSIGGVIGVGVETPLADTWTLRLEGLYLDFDGKTHFVNRSGDNRCGPRRNRRPCSYNLDNTLSTVRLAIIRRFGG